MVLFAAAGVRSTIGCNLCNGMIWITDSQNQPDVPTEARVYDIGDVVARLIAQYRSLPPVPRTAREMFPTT